MQPRLPFAVGILTGVALLLGAVVLLAVAPTETMPTMERQVEELDTSGHTVRGRQLQAGRTRSMKLVRLVTGGGAGEGDSSGAVMDFIIRFVMWAIWSTCALVFACMYKTKVVDTIPIVAPKSSANASFKAGLFQCFGNCHLCMHSFCCGACRLGHSMQVAGVCEYWPAVMLWYLLPCCNVCCGVYHRIRLRQKLGLAPDICCDILSYLFCACCAIGQDAIEVDVESGAEVSCCCTVNVQAKLAPPVAAGPVVIMGTPAQGEVLQRPKE